MILHTPHPQFSLVVCTYNPQERILRRCLAAIALLNRQGIAAEVILVDNNSTPGVQDMECVQHFRPGIPAMRVLHESRPGVKFARMRAIEEAAGDYVVYVDTDNELEANYLQELAQLIKQYPQVGAWGPGVVQVEFLDGVPPHLESCARAAFQERHESEIRMAREQEWQDCYPFGTGLCIRTDVLREYNRLALNGIFTFEGRKGNSLTSGEDTQMILLAIRIGYFAGVAPSLRLKHLIPAGKANWPYMKRLAFGTAVCYEPALLEVFPERETLLQTRLLKKYTFLRRALRRVLKARNKMPAEMLAAIQFVGLQAGVYEALGKPLPAGIQYLIHRLKWKG